MRMLHTSDWHVGKTLKGRSRLDEHRLVLADIVEIARTHEVDAVLIAGDLYDSTVPSAEAQRLVVKTLLDLRSTGAEVLVIAGKYWIYPMGYGITPGGPAWSAASPTSGPARPVAPAAASAYIGAVQIPPWVYESVDPKGTPMSMTAGSGVEVVAIDTPALGDRSYLAHDGRGRRGRRPAAGHRPGAGPGRGPRECGSPMCFETHLHNDYVTGGLALARADRGGLPRQRGRPGGLRPGAGRVTATSSRSAR